MGIGKGYGLRCGGAVWRVFPFVGLRGRAGVRAHRCGERLVFRLCDRDGLRGGHAALRGAVEQDRGTLLTGFQSVGRIPFVSGNGLPLGHGLYYLHVKGKHGVHYRGGSDGLFPEDDRGGLLLEINDIEIRVVAAAHPGGAVPGLRRILEAPPGIADSEDRNLVRSTRGVSEQTEIGGVHLRGIMRIRAADGKGIVRVRFRHKVQRSGELVSHGIGAKRGVCLRTACGGHVAQRAAGCHALVADGQLFFPIIDEPDRFAVLQRGEIGRSRVFDADALLYAVVLDGGHRVFL